MIATLVASDTKLALETASMFGLEITELVVMAPVDSPLPQRVYDLDPMLPGDTGIKQRNLLMAVYSDVLITLGDVDPHLLQVSRKMGLQIHQLDLGFTPQDKPLERLATSESPLAELGGHVSPQPEVDLFA